MKAANTGFHYFYLFTFIGYRLTPENHRRLTCTLGVYHDPIWPGYPQGFYSNTPQAKYDAQPVWNSTLPGKEPTCQGKIDITCT